MKTCLNLICIVVCLSLVSCGREKGSDQDVGSADGTANSGKSSDAGPSTLPEKLKSDNDAKFESSGTSMMAWIPQDALAAVVVHPRRAAKSDVGQALQELASQSGLLEPDMLPDEVERIVHAVGIPTEESENDCTIVQYTQPIPRETLLLQAFEGLPYEEVQFQGATYYRYAEEFSAESGDSPPPNAGLEIPPAITEHASTLAKYPEDFQPNANGHADSTGSGNWFYYSSQTINPTLPDAELKQLRWNQSRNSYVSPRGKMGNDKPAVNKSSLEPSPFPPRYAVLRWESPVAAEIRLRGNFHKYSSATGSNGVRVFVFVDGEQKFSAEIKPKDTIGVDYDLAASLKPSSRVDFVVDPKGNASRDSTFVSATIEVAGESTSATASQGDSDEQPAVNELETAAFSSTAVFFADDKTIVSTDEQRLRTLISTAPLSTPLTKKLADLDHDMIVVVGLEGFQDQLAGLLAAVAEETGLAELAGLSVLPQHTEFAVATLDLSGDTLLSVTVDAASEASAGEVEGGFDLLLDGLEGLRHVLPAESRLLPLLKQVLVGTTVQTNGSQVVLTTKMPEGLAEFIRDDAAATIAELAATAPEPMDAMPDAVPERPLEEEPAVDDSEDIVYRTPPKDHPQFRDLAVGSHDCRVFFPGKPEFTEQNVKIPEGNVHVANFQGRTARAAYIFEIYTYPAAFVANTGADALLKQTRDNIVDVPRGRLISSTPMTYQKSPALDFVYEHPDTTGAGQGHCRVVLRGNRVYLLEVDGFKVASAEISVFHDSLAPFALRDGSSPKESSLPPIVDKPKLPVPDEADREKSLTLVRELYQKEFQTATTSSDKAALAATIIAGAAAVEVPADRFVLLDVARKVAIDAGDLDVVLDAVTQIDDEFKIDSPQLSYESLLQLAKASMSTDDRIRLCGEMLDAGQLAVDADRYAVAIALLREAAANARKARDFELAKSAGQRLDESTQLESKFSTIQSALKTLQADPDDAGANLAVGKYHCLMKGQWDEGLPYLAKGDDARLKSLAEQDRAAPTSTDLQTKLADQWYELASASEGLSVKHLQLRSAHWYRRVLPNLTLLQKEVVEKRLAEMKYVVEAAGPKIVFLTDVPMLGAEGVLINDGKGHFREERLKGEVYPQVLWAHPQDNAPSHYAFTLNRNYSKLAGKAAINDVQSVDRAQKPQLFAIYGDKRLLWKSRPLQNKLDSEQFSVNVANVRTLHLYVAGGGYGGHALWVDLVLEKKR